MKYSLILVVALAFAYCGARQEKARAGNVDSVAIASTDTATKAYFPVSDFLRGEISAVDSLPVGILKYTTRGKKTDSAYIKPEEFHQLANQFISDDLSSPRFERSFAETSFFDRTTNSSTFLYTAKDSALKVQRVDVISATGDVYDKIKSIYVETTDRQGATLIVKKMYWKPERNFQISTLVTGPSGIPQVDLVKVVWDNRD